jgi:dTDP-glucose 4,6-dehydratase
VISTAIQQALAQRRIQLGTITTRRDFTYVSDTVAGFIAAAEAGDDVLGLEINLGTGRDVAISEIVAMIRDAIDPSIPIESDSKRMRPEASEVLRLCSDNTLARQRLGWAPQVSLEDGVMRTIAWAREAGRFVDWQGYAR